MKNRYILLFLFNYLVCLGQNSKETPIYQIDFSIHNNQILLKSTINNLPVNLLFDTGSMGICLDKSFVLRNSINYLKTYKSPLKIRLNKFSETVKLISIYNIRKQLGDTFQGILGVDFFKNYLVEIDYVNKNIKLYKPEAKIYTSYKKLNTTHNTKNIQIFKRFTTPISIQIDSITEITGDFLIDTGSSRNISTINLLDQYKSSLISSKKKRKVLNASPHGFNNPVYYKIPNLTFNNKSYKNLIIDDNNDINHNTNGFNGILGGGFLKNFKILINYKNSAVYIKEQPLKNGFVKNIISDGIKIKEYKFPEKKLIIGSVFNSKLKVGDEVLEINNVNYKKIVLDKYYANKKNNDTIIYLIKRNNKTLKIKTIVKKIFSREE